MVVNRFEPCGIDNSIANSIASLLYGELYRLQCLYQKNEYESLGKTDFPIMPLSISIIEDFRNIKSQLVTISYSDTKVSFPISLLHFFIKWPKPKITISGSIVNEEGKRVIICYMKGFKNDRVFRINSHYGLHDNQKSESGFLPDQIELLASKIFAVYYDIEETPELALRSYNEGIRAYIDSTNSPQRKNILLYHAERHFRSALYNYNKYTRAKLMLGLIYYSFKLNKCAINVLNSILNDKTDNVKAYASLAHIKFTDVENRREIRKFYLNKNSNIEFPEEHKQTVIEIERLCDHLLLLEKENAIGYSIKSNLFFIQKKHPEAISEANKALTASKRLGDNEIMIEALQMIAISFSKLYESTGIEKVNIEINGKWKSFNCKQCAVDSINKAISLDKNSSTSYYFKGRILTRFNDFDLAIKEFQKVLTLNPDDIDTWGNVAECQFLSDMVKDQISVTMKQLQKCPSAVSEHVFNRVNQAMIDKNRQNDFFWVKDFLDFKNNIDKLFTRIENIFTSKDPVKDTILIFIGIIKSLSLITFSQEKDWMIGQIAAIIGRIYFKTAQYSYAYIAFKIAKRFLRGYPREIIMQKINSFTLLTCIFARQTPTKKEMSVTDYDPLDSFYYEAIAEQQYREGNYQYAVDNFGEAIAYQQPEWKPVRLWPEPWNLFHYRIERLFIRKSACHIRYAEITKIKKDIKQNLKSAIDALKYSTGFLSLSCCNEKSEYEQASHYWFGRAYLANGNYAHAIEEFCSAALVKNGLLAKFYKGITYRTARDLPSALRIFSELDISLSETQDNDVIPEKSYLEFDWDFKKLYLINKLEYLAVLSAVNCKDRQPYDEFINQIEKDFEIPKNFKAEFESYKRISLGIIHFHMGNYKDAIEVLDGILCHTSNLEVFEHLQMAYIEQSLLSTDIAAKRFNILKACTLCDQVEEFDFVGDVHRRMIKRMDFFKGEPGYPDKPSKEFS